MVICIPIFIAALFTVAKRSNQSKCPSTDEWINEMNIYIQCHIQSKKKGSSDTYMDKFSKQYTTKKGIHKRTGIIMIPIGET